MAGNSVRKQSGRTRKRSLLMLGVIILFFMFSLMVTWQLVVIHRKLDERDGEHMVWALTQAQNQGTQLERDVELFRAGEISREALSLREDIFFSRLTHLLDEPQMQLLHLYGQGSAVKRAIDVFLQTHSVGLADMARDSEMRPALGQLNATLSAAGNQVMVRERDDSSYQLDQLGGLIQAAFVAISMVVVTGGLLIWQLTQLLARRHDQLNIIAEQRDTLQQTVHDLHQAQNATETYRNFVSLVSHQFRTPLAVIDSTAQRLIRAVNRYGPMDTEQLMEKMALTRSTVDGLTKLLDSVLLSVRLEAGGVELQKRPVNLADLAETVVELNDHVLQGRSLELQIAGQRADYESIGDPRLLEHVLQNLLANACKYTPSGSPLAMSLGRRGDFVVCTLRDWGAGVPQEDLPLLFERFYRSSHSLRSAGTGLGLYLARSIAHLHGGDMTASLPMGGGLAVSLYLPFAVAEHDIPR